jgi:YbbR domain-containing protein
VPVDLEAVDERIRIINWEPTRVRVQLDPFVTRTVPVQVHPGEIPEGLDVRDPVVEPAEVEVSGPQSVVERVVAARASVLIEPSALNVDRDVSLVPIDLVGEVLRPVDVDPATAHVTIAVFRDLSNRSLAVSPRVVGTPARGFEIASVTVEPVLVSVEGNADELASLDRIPTDPISIAGATADVNAVVELDLPTGILALGDSTVRVTIRLRPVIETRSFNAGIRLTGARDDRIYSLSTDRVVITVFGSPSDLDRLATAPLSVDAAVGGLEPGASLVRVEANLAAGLTLVAVAPATVTVTVALPATPTPEPTIPASPSPSPSP